MSKIYTIGEVAKLNQSSIATNDVFESIEYLDTSSLTENKINNLQTLNKNFPSRAKRKVKNNTILYSTVRPNLEHHGILQNIDCSRLIASTGFTTIDVDESIANPKYVYYKLTQPFITQYLQTVAESAVSAYPSIKPNDISTLKFRFPELEIQRKIAGVLSALDDKIELNRRESAELEQMARTLYDYWFVQFDFPDAHGKPYKTSGGPMKHSPELNRQIPTAWEVKKLDDIISRSGTGLNPRQNFRLGQGSNYYVTIKNVENGKIILDDKCDKIDDEALKIIQKRSDLQPGDILFTSIQPVGVTYLIHEKPTNWNINESVFTIRPNYEKVTSEYLYMLLSSAEMKVYTTNSSAGSVHKGIRHAVLKDFNAVIVPKEVIDAFSEKIKPILEKMYKNDQQSQNLAHLRDWFLPMLMNGQVSVE